MEIPALCFKQASASLGMISNLTFNKSSYQRSNTVSILTSSLNNQLKGLCVKVQYSHDVVYVETLKPFFYLCGVHPVALFTYTMYMNIEYMLYILYILYVHIVYLSHYFQLGPKPSLNCNRQTSSSRAIVEPPSIQQMGNLLTQRKENYTMTALARFLNIKNMDAEHCISLTSQKYL
jgi:hypothetical protein